MVTSNGLSNYGSTEVSSLLEGSSRPSSAGGIAINNRSFLCVSSDNKVLFTLALLCFVDSMFSMCLVAFVPELMVDQYPFSVALVFSLYSASVLAGNYLCRRIGQNIGRRFMVLCGICGLWCAAATSIYAFKKDREILMVLARIVQGFSSAAIQTGALGIVLDVCANLEDSHTEDAYANVITANAFGAALGPVVGGILFTLRGTQFVFLMFVIAVGCAGLATAFYVDLPESPLPTVSYKGHLGDRSMVVASAGLALVAMCMSLLWTSFPVHLLEKFDTREAVVGLVFTLLLLSHDIFLPVIYGFLELRQEDDRPVFLAGAFVMLAVFAVLLVWAKVFLAMAAMLFLFGFSAALGMSVLATDLTERSKANISIYQLKEAAFLVGTTVGPLLGGIFAPGSLTPYYTVSALCLLYVPVYYTTMQSVEAAKGI